MATGLMGKISSALGVQSGQGPHKIIINVGEVNNLIKPAGDRRLEPYVAFTINGEMKTRNKTKTLKQGTDFQGNTALFNTDQTMYCNLETDQLHIELWNDAPLFSKDNLLGETVFPLRELLTSGGAVPLDRWFTFSTAGGAFSSQQQQQQVGMQQGGMMGQQAGVMGQQAGGLGQQAGGYGTSGTTGVGAGGMTTMPSVHLQLRVVEGLVQQQQAGGVAGGQTAGMAGQQQQQAGLGGTKAGYPSATTTTSTLPQSSTGVGSSGMGSSGLSGQQYPGQQQL